MSNYCRYGQVWRVARPDEHVHHIACVLHITHGKQVLEKL